MKSILIVLGTRPEAIKMAPVIKRLQAERSLKVKICATAQHRHMLDQVLEVFKIKPDYDLNIMQEGQTLSYITSTVTNRISGMLKKEKFDLILVHGDTTTTFAASLAAFYNSVPAGHVEAGLRSFDISNPYPEEVNRCFTDKLCTLLFPPTRLAQENLLKEGISKSKIFVTGNTIIDALFLALKKKHEFKDPALKNIFKPCNSFMRNILVTAHRRENFGNPLRNICHALKEIADKYPDIRVIYPVHPNPNVRKPVNEILANHKRILLIKPVDYFDFVNLMKHSYIIVTDSGGIQEEAPSLKKPVLILRKVTERPEAVRAGTAKIVGTDKNRIVQAASNLLQNKKVYQHMTNIRNPYGDGRASDRIAKAIKKYFNQ